MKTPFREAVCASVFPRAERNPDCATRDRRLRGANKILCEDQRMFCARFRFRLQPPEAFRRRKNIT